MLTSRLVAAVALTLAGASLLAAVPQSDLDAFMATVLERRDENWKKLQQYILDEREVVRLRGPAEVPIWGEEREYSWFIQEGYFVRSPVKANGVEISETDRREYEAEYLRRAKERDEEEEENPDPAAGERVTDRASSTPDGLLVQVREPQFIDTAYFLEFEFEEGTYALVGPEEFEGRDVLRIEYYPTKLFSDEDEREQRRRRDREDEVEDAFERMMNKVSLVTIWVEPSSHQIVKYTFDNVNLDFLPAAWLLRVTDLKAEMTMSEAFPDVWLPRDIDFRFGAMLAIGSFDVRYEIDYFDYREALTSGRIRRSPGGR